MMGGFRVAHFFVYNIFKTRYNGSLIRRTTMRVTDEILYNIFNEYDRECWFSTPCQAALVREKIDALGNFDKLYARYNKLTDRICWLRRCTEYDVTVIEEDGRIWYENRVDSARRWGQISDKDEKIIKMAGISK